MDKIIYKNITTNDNIVLIVQALIDKQAKIIDWINRIQELRTKLIEIGNEREKLIDKELDRFLEETKDK